MMMTVGPILPQTVTHCHHRTAQELIYTAFILIKRNELQSVIIMYVFVLCISTILIITGLLLQHFLLPPFYKPILVFDYIDIHLFFVLETNH